MSSVLLCYLALMLLTVAAELFPIPVYAHMLPATLLIIYIGSHTALANLNDKDAEKAERMETKDAYMFPVVGSCVLFGLYLAFKFLPKEYLLVVAKAYFFLIGVLVLGAKFSWILERVLPSLAAVLKPRAISFIPPAILVKLFSEKKPDNPEDCRMTVTALDVLGALAAFGVAIWYITTNHWAANNVFGMAFSIQGIEMISLGSYFNGVVLLIGLFFYDIFWVFGTEVMVTVAKSLDAPIKLLFPRPGAERPSMLGLGDIVIPGIFIALMLKFDHHLRQKDRAAHQSNTYFRAQMVFYLLGLTLTLSVMYFFNAAQPALLYLVPTCLISSLGLAAIKGQVKELWGFEEAVKEEEAGEGSDASKKDD